MYNTNCAGHKMIVVFLCDHHNHCWLIWSTGLYTLVGNGLSSSYHGYTSCITIAYILAQIIIYTLYPAILWIQQLQNLLTGFSTD